MDALELIQAKRAEYAAELAKIDEQRIAFIGAIAACDDLLEALKGKPDENQVPG